MQRVQRIQSKIVRNLAGLAIRYHREEKDISQEELAARAGISRTYLSLVENKKRIPSFDLLKKIASCLDETVTELILGSMREDCKRSFRLLVLQVTDAVREVIDTGDEEKKRKLIEFMEMLLASP